MAKRALQGWLPEFDAIAFRGMSGALIAPPVARGLKKSLIMVRKPSEGCHSLLFVEGDTKAKAYIILDEYTSSGTTQREIRKAVAEFAPQAVCLGLLEVQYIRQESLDQYADGKYRLVYNNPDDPNEYRMKDSE